MNIPRAVLHQINFCVSRRHVIDGQTSREAQMARNTVIFLLQQLNFVFNLKKSALTLTQKMEFKVLVDSSSINLSLTKTDEKEVQTQCQRDYSESQNRLVYQLTKRIGFSQFMQYCRPK